MTTHDDFMSSLLSSHRASGDIKPSAFYNAEGDCIQFLVRPETYRGKRINGQVTIYVSLETGKVMGAMVKGIRSIIQKYKGVVLMIDEGNAPMEQMLFLGLSLEEFREGDVRKPFCREVLRMAKDISCDIGPALNESEDHQPQRQVPGLSRRRKADLMTPSEAVRRLTGLRLKSWEVREAIDRIQAMPNRNTYINHEVEKLLKCFFPNETIDLDVVEAVVKQHFKVIR